MTRRLPEREPRLVLKYRKCSKHASDQRVLGVLCPLHALNLSNRGQGGGIVPLLLPSSPSETRRLAGHAKRFTTDWVLPRNRVDHKLARDALECGPLLAQLRELHVANFHSARPPKSLSMKRFRHWLRAEAAVDGSAVRQVLGERAPELLELIDDGKLTDRWFIDRFAARKEKMPR